MIVMMKVCGRQLCCLRLVTSPSTNLISLSFSHLTCDRHDVKIASCLSACAIPQKRSLPILQHRPELCVNDSFDYIPPFHSSFPPHSLSPSLPLPRKHPSVVWSPYHINEINKLESVQRRFTKRIVGLSSKSYTERTRNVTA